MARKFTKKRVAPAELFVCLFFCFLNLLSVLTSRHVRHIRDFTIRRGLGLVRTNAFSKVCVFVVIEKASIDSCPHYRFFLFVSSITTQQFQ